MSTKDEQVKEEEAKTPEQIEFERALTETIFSGPAVFANRIFVTVSALGVRFTFIEQQENAAPQFRAAAYLNILDAIAFRNLVDEQFDRLGMAIAADRAAEEAAAAAASEENGD